MREKDTEERSNVIDLKLRRQGGAAKKPSARDQVAAPVVDMTERRQEILSDERRRVKRTILSEFIGASIVVPERGLIRVTLYDVSENGLAFDMESKRGALRAGEEVALRVYLNHQTYFPLSVVIQHARFIEDERVYRHGSLIKRGSINDAAIYHFVRFIETVSAGLQKDSGDVMVSNLNR